MTVAVGVKTLPRPAPTKRLNWACHYALYAPRNKWPAYWGDYQLKLILKMRRVVHFD